MAALFAPMAAVDLSVATAATSVAVLSAIASTAVPQKSLLAASLSGPLLRGSWGLSPWRCVLGRSDDWSDGQLALIRFKL
jgi:hypothetical protein